jgi:ribose transport system permease protein
VNEVKRVRQAIAGGRLETSGSLPLGVFVLVVIAFLLTPEYGGGSLAGFDIFNTFQGFASVGLITLAVGLSMVIGEFDLSVTGMQALGGVLAVKAGQHNGILGIAAAVAACGAIGCVQGMLIARLRIGSMPVTLGGYIALLGVTSVIADDKTVPFSNTSASVWVDHQLTSWISARGAIAVGAFVLAFFVLNFTRAGVDLRAIGADRRAARVLGVRVDRYVVGVFGVSGALSALAGAMLAYSNSVATLNPGIQPLILAVGGAVLGGVSLAGGRGRMWGLLLGAVSVSLLQEVFDVAALSSSSTELVFGTILMIVVVFDAPGLRVAANQLRGLVTR